jgi:hypothetical protein
MKKPRCIVCDAATKRVYERTGSKAQFNGINRWWYCPSCLKMQLGPYLPSENKEDYADPDAAKKFPKISKILQENFDKSGYHHINELMETRPNPEHYDDFSELTAKLQKYWGYKVYNPQMKETIQGFWICDVCGEREPVVETENGIRMHCDKEMKITVVPFITSDRVKEVIEGLQSSYSNSIENEEFDKAGEQLLEIVLYNLDHNTNYELSRDIFNLVLVEAIKRQTELRQTWGFISCVNLMQAFDGSKGALSRAIIEDDYSDVRIGTSLHIKKNSKEILTDVFSDIQLKLRDDPVKMARYRLIFNGIKQNIDEINGYRKLIKEWNEQKLKLKIKPYHHKEK